MKSQGSATSSPSGAARGYQIRLVPHDPQHIEKHHVEIGGSGYEMLKRGFDLFGSFLLLCVAAPVMVIIGILVVSSSPGPAIFSQRRLTRGGKEFTLHKFRTMRLEAEERTGPVFASSGDPRVTPLGRFLRKTRLDELPQLLNVIAGDMSLVGPRPERPELAATLKGRIPRFEERLGAKAGLTGLAQVVQGYPEAESGYKRKLALDLLYIRKRSFMLDCWILFRTVGVVLTGRGAR